MQHISYRFLNNNKNIEGPVNIKISVAIINMSELD